MSRALRMGRGSGCGPDADAKKSGDFYDSPARNGASGRETGIDTEKYGSFCDSGGHGNLRHKYRSNSAAIIREFRCQTAGLMQSFAETG